MIQPIPNVYYIKNNSRASLFSVTPFTITTSYMGGLPGAAATPLMFGLLCVSDSDEECLLSSLTGTPTSGAVITIQFSTSLGSFMDGSQGITVEPATVSTTKNNVYSTIPQATPFYASILNAVSGKYSS